MALANISLTTIVATTATFAWFVNNKVVSASGIEMSISADTGVDLRYEVIKYDDDIKEGISFQGNAENFSLPKYDRYISYNHKYENAILRADVGFNAFDKTKELTIDITCSQPLFDVGSTTNVAPKTSNVIQFKTSVISYTTDQLTNNKYKLNQYIEDETGEDGFLTDAALSYETARTYFATQPIATSFVSAFNNTGSKYHYTVTCIPYIPNDTMLADVHIQSAVIYIECSYNEEAVEYYINNHNENNSTDFDGDITSIKFGVTNHVNGGYERVTDLSKTLTDGGEYLAVKNDGDEKIHKDYALDGSLDAANIGSKANFNQVDIKNNAISANSVIKQRDLNITNNNGAYYVRSQGANYLTKDSSSTQIASSSNGVSHSISNNELVLADSNTYALAYRNSRGDDRFGYIASGTNKQSIEYFKYNGSYEAPVLSSITATPNKTLYSVGDSFKVSDVTVTATYSNGDTKNVTESCTYQGYDFSVSGAQTIYVYYSENNVTVSTDYQINVTSSPVVTLDKYELTLLHVNGGKQATIQATATNFTSDSLTYTWSIDNPSVLNITPSGSSITIQTNAYGTATLTCTVEDNDGHTAYNSCKVYVITTSTIWRLVTDASSLSVGDTVVIAAAGYDYAIGAQGNNNRSQATVAKNDVDKTLSFDNNAGVVSFTIAKGNINNTYAFQTEGGNYLYAAGSSKNNYLREQKSLDDNGSWKIEISSNGVASIVAQGTYTNNIIRYNSTSSLFSCYDSGQKDVAIYRLEAGNALKSLSVSVDVAVPYPLKQYDGRKFDCPSGVTFNATYADGTTEEIPSSKIVFNGGAALKFGDTMITASYTENGVTKSTIIDVNVHRIELQSIAITSNAKTTNYLSGSYFQPAGLIVTATFNYGNETITNDPNLVWNGGNALTKGQTSVTASFTYNNGESDTVKEATYNGITVVKKTLTSIKVAEGYKETYAVGETFSFSSTVTAHFNEGSAVTSNSTLTSDEYTIKVGSNVVGAVPPTFAKSDIGTISVTISYTFDGETKTFAYDITVTDSLVFSKYDGAITEGKYILAYTNGSNNTFIMSSFDSSYYNKVDSNPINGQYINPDSKNVWIVEKDDTGYLLKNEETGQYVLSKNTNDAGQGSKSADAYLNFFYNSSAKTYSIQSNAYTSRYLQYNASSPRWAFYKGTEQNPTLYKLNYTPASVSNVTLDQANVTLNAPTTNNWSNGTVTLNPTVTGTGSVSQDVTWSSSNDSVATVNQDGLVTATGVGTATITATSVQDGTKSATCTITVDAATTISITEKPTQLLEGGEFYSVTASITAGWDSSSNTADKITWSSSNESALVVSGSSGNNLIGELLTGDVNEDTTVTITATLPNGNSVSCDILVKKSAPSTIAFNDSSTSSLTSGGEGTLSVTITQGTDFDSQSVTWTSSNNSVIKISNGTKTGATITAGTVNSITSVTITATLTNGNSATWEVTVTPAAATEKTVQYTFNSKSWGSTNDGTLNGWTSGKAGNGFSNGGVQVTTKSSGANATSIDSFTNISKIVVTYCTNNKDGVGTIYVKVGNNADKSYSVTAPSSNGTTAKTCTFTYSTLESGKVKITVNCKSNSIYIIGIAITYAS
ncbi:MAG: Ig-like domain-containing protein [Bacilli bacterium]|nr:Ig-like domain-containing protein [Bacilli bacterium]